jgi:hypothetical protein
MEPLDYENISSYSLNITATELYTTEKYSTNFLVTITVLDVNDLTITGVSVLYGSSLSTNGTSQVCKSFFQA